MAKTLIIGDPHIGRSTASMGKPGIGNALNSRLVDQSNILEWILLQAIELAVNNIIITGDVFHEPKPHPTVVCLLISWLKRCTDADINVHIIAGNHDVFRSGQYHISALDIISAADIDNIYIYKDMSTIHTIGASFTLLPFRDRRSFNTDSNTAALKIINNRMPYELAGIERSHAKVVIGHFAMEGSIPVGDEIDDMGNELFCPVSMFNGYDYVWMGHIHKPQIMSKNPFVAHIGSMDLSDFGEASHKKYIVIFDPDSSEHYKYIEIPTRAINQISVSVPENIENPTEYVINEINKTNNLNKSIVKLNISLDNSEKIYINRSLIEQSLIDKGVFHITRINEERKVNLIKKNITETIDNTVNESTAIKMFAEANIDESIRNDFISLANNIVKEIKE